MPAWAPDNRTFSFVSGTNPTDFAVHLSSVGATSPAKRLSDGTHPTFSPDGDSLVFVRYGFDPSNYTEEDIYRIGVEGDGPPEVLIQTRSRESWPQVSPDGNWLAYASDDSGTFEVYLQPFPDGATKWLVSTRGGFWPKWNSKGDNIYYSELRFNSP